MITRDMLIEAVNVTDTDEFWKRMEDVDPTSMEDPVPIAYALGIEDGKKEYREVIAKLKLELDLARESQS